MRCSVFAIICCCMMTLLWGCDRRPVARTDATLVLRNGKVVTVDPAVPQGQAIAIRDDRIVAVGSDDAIQAYIGPGTQVIDLAGRLAVPGLIEGHGHLMNLGDMKMNLDLTTAKNWDEIITLVAAAAQKAQPGDWIVGRGWHQEKWDHIPEPNVEGFPLHDALSRATPNNPVLLTHASGHATFINAQAMEAAHITATTPNPAGGEILHDPSGRPTGLLRETASNLATRAMANARAAHNPSAQHDEARRKIDLAVQEAISHGITSFQDAGEDFPTIDIIKEAVSQGLPLRLWIMVRDTNPNLRAKLPRYKTVGLYDDHLTIAAIKTYMDGALGSRGAWMLQPYADSPGHSGMNVTPVSEIEETARIALDQNVQLCIHAIGDRANRQVLDIYEAAFKTRPDLHNLRWRIEHAQHLDPADIPRFAQLGVIASMQGIHATSDAPFVIARIGQQRAEQGAYAWQKLMHAGAIVSNGTDTPVERIDPIANFYATTTRKLKDGTTFFPDQRLTREEALRASTWCAAYAAKEEGIKGTLTPGKLADVTVLSRDILTVPDDEILATQVVYTIVGGKIIYRQPGRD